ncbi:MAG TPA: DNA primase [Kiritimatiellia bacterium]|mgnify:FL=1|nr:DNA primase [Kiritimatiellia bacterium]HMP95621.1 DNA primase [Kiritimatiellia bacterium]
MPGPDFKTTIETIRDHNEITEVIGSYVQLKRAGSSFKACCPFHKEKTPSFHVNPTRQTFHCFGCGAGGDVFNFIMRYESLDFMQAARRLAERAGLAFDIDPGASTGMPKSQKDALLALHAQLAVWYQRCLRESGQAETARTYLKDRGLDDTTVETFGIGYAPARDMNWTAWARKRDYAMEGLVQAGILVAKEEGGWYDRFADRLMFPIHDETGRVIGFSGRILPGDTRPAKYVNSPETPLFTKSKVIYALHLAKREILDKKEALICEGQIDVIRCHMAGFRHAVAAQGTAITDQHARILKRFTDAVRLALDSDEAGQNAALRSTDTLIEAGLNVRVARLPSGDDPDTLIRRDGATAFLSVLDAAQPALEFQIDTLMSREATMDDAAIRRTARAVLDSIARSPSELERENLLQRAGARLGIRPDLLASELRQQMRRTPRRDTPEEPAAPLPDMPAYPREELEIVRLLMHHPHSAELFARYLEPGHFQSGICRDLYERLLAHAYDEHFDLMADLLAAPEEARRVAAMLLTEERFLAEDMQSEKAAQDLVVAMYKRILELERRNLDQRRRQAVGEEAKRLDMEIMEITLNQHTLRSGWAKAGPMLELMKTMRASS